MNLSLLFRQANLKFVFSYSLVACMGPCHCAIKNKKSFIWREIFFYSNDLSIILNMVYILQHDVKTALFLLPHVLLYVLLDGTQEDVEEVRYSITFP